MAVDLFDSTCWAMRVELIDEKLRAETKSQAASSSVRRAMKTPFANASLERKEASGLLSAFFGVVEIPDHHFFEGLISPGDPRFGIGVVEVGIGVVEGRFAVDA